MCCHRNPAFVALASIALVCQFGCQGRPGYRLLSLIGLAHKPLVVSHVIDQPTDLAQFFNPFEPYKQLNTALGKATGRKVISDLCFPFQVEPNLDLGIGHLAIVTPLHYAQIRHRDRFEVLAISVDQQRRAARSALLVVRASSEIETIEQLRGKVVGFGPPGDLRTHHAGLLLLQTHGIARTDLKLEVLPLPGSLKHFPDMRSIAQSVINNSSDAGVVDIAAWEQWPEIAKNTGDPARGELRVLGETEALPSWLILRSPALDEITARKAQALLLSVDDQHPEALKPLGFSAFRAPDPAILDACVRCAEYADSTPADGAEPSS